MIFRVLSILTMFLICAKATLGVTPGLKDMGMPPAGYNAGAAVYGVSPDGSDVVGRLKLVDGSYAEMGMMWTESGGMIDISGLPGDIVITELNAVSANGSIAVGRGYGASSDYHAAYTTGTHNVDMGNLDGGEDRSWATGVSADGSVIVGASDSANGKFAFRWTAAEGMVSLGDFDGGIANSTAHAVSADGTTIVGYGTRYGYSGIAAFRWREGTGMVALEWPDAGSSRTSEAIAVSRDGSVVVGRMWYKEGELQHFRGGFHLD